MDETIPADVRSATEQIDQYIPAMNVSMPNPVDDQGPELIADEVLVGIYCEILDTIRQDRVEVSDIINNFCEMVMNQGDSSNGSKEAIVSLIKTKLDSADKMVKVADLMTRVKLKDKDTFPRYLTAKQENTINIGDGGKKELLKRLNNAQKKAKKETQ